MELLNPPDRARTRWLPFGLGCAVGAVPWIAIAVRIGVSAGRGHAPPSFVYAILVSLFVLFNSFAGTRPCSTSGSGAGATTATASAGISG